MGADPLKTGCWYTFLQYVKVEYGKLASVISQPQAADLYDWAFCMLW